MPVITMLRARTEAEARTEAAQLGAVNVRDVGPHYHTNPDSEHYGVPLFVADKYVGRCIAERERNMHDDSDFYMLVWHDGENGGAAVETCFASTRGWCYPCMGSSVDATPEVLAKYEAFKARKAAEAAARSAAIEARTPRKGRTVRVIGGRKLPKGTEAVVFWERITERGFEGENGYWWPAKGRVGLEVPGAGRVFVDAGQVEVVAEAR